jgi:hypothetical protein
VFFCLSLLVLLRLLVRVCAVLDDSVVVPTWMGAHMWGSIVCEEEWIGLVVVHGVGVPQVRFETFLARSKIEGAGWAWGGPRPGGSPLNSSEASVESSRKVLLLITRLIQTSVDLAICNQHYKFF